MNTQLGADTANLQFRLGLLEDFVRRLSEELDELAQIVRSGGVGGGGIGGSANKFLRVVDTGAGIPIGGSATLSYYDLGATGGLGSSPGTDTFVNALPAAVPPSRKAWAGLVLNSDGTPVWGVVSVSCS